MDTSLFIILFLMLGRCLHRLICISSMCIWYLQMYASTLSFPRGLHLMWVANIWIVWCDPSQLFWILNRFGAFRVKLQTQDEALMVHAFGQGIMAWMFNVSLIKNQARTFWEIRRRAVAHISAKEAVSMKCDSTYPGQTKPKEGSRA